MTRSIAVLTVLAFAYAQASHADAYCQAPTEDGTVWNLVCVANEAHELEDVYQCDYILTVTDAAGMTQQSEATGAVWPGQDNAVIWSSAVLGDDAQIVSASIVSGSCSQ
jgi:hypothetical protein